MDRSQSQPTLPGRADDACDFCFEPFEGASPSAYIKPPGKVPFSVNDEVVFSDDSWRACAHCNIFITAKEWGRSYSAPYQLCDKAREIIE